MSFGAALGYIRYNGAAHEVSEHQWVAQETMFLPLITPRGGWWAQRWLNMEAWTLYRNLIQCGYHIWVASFLAGWSTAGRHMLKVCAAELHKLCLPPFPRRLMMKWFHITRGVGEGRRLRNCKSGGQPISNLVFQDDLHREVSGDQHVKENLGIQIAY